MSAKVDHKKVAKQAQQQAQGQDTTKTNLQNRIETNSTRKGCSCIAKFGLFALGLVLGIVVTVVGYEHYGFNLEGVSKHEMVRDIPLLDHYLSNVVSVFKE